MRYFSSSSFVSADTRSKILKFSEWARHNLAVAHIAAKLGPTLDIINQTLYFKGSYNITQDHIDLCEYISNTPVKFPLLSPGSKGLIAFKKIAGPTKVKSQDQEVPGCYLISGTSTSDTYVGQSKHLGGRIVVHASGIDKGTGQFVKFLNGEGTVDLFLIGASLIPTGLTLIQFVTVLEQFLFFKFRPTINKKFVATPGGYQSPSLITTQPELIISTETQLLKGDTIRSPINSMPVFAYNLDEWGSLILIQSFDSGVSVGLSLNMSRTFFKNLLSRDSGWFKKTVYFTQVEIEGSDINLMTLAEFKTYIGDIYSINPKSTQGFKCVITNTITGEIHSYHSIRQCAREFGCDPFVLVPGRTKLYKKIYKIDVTLH